MTGGMTSTWAWRRPPTESAAATQAKPMARTLPEALAPQVAPMPATARHTGSTTRTAVAADSAEAADNAEGADEAKVVDHLMMSRQKEAMMTMMTKTKIEDRTASETTVKKKKKKKKKKTDHPYIASGAPEAPGPATVGEEAHRLPRHPSTPVPTETPETSGGGSAA